MFARLMMGTVLASPFGFVTAPAAQAASVDPLVLKQINKIRVSKGLTRLRPMPKLNAAARRHSASLARSGTLHHNGFAKRIFGSGIPGLRIAGENVAYVSGCSTSGARIMVRAWMRSPGHRQNILSSSFRMIGVGSALRGSCGATYTTTEFAG
jgi:uncharacterized protein YkwD